LYSYGNADITDKADKLEFWFHDSLFMAATGKPFRHTCLSSAFIRPIRVIRVPIVLASYRKTFPAYLPLIRFYPPNPRHPRSHCARVVPENLSSVQD
jgi:hypothetical protein